MSAGEENTSVVKHVSTHGEAMSVLVNLDIHYTQTDEHVCKLQKQFDRVMS